MSDEHIHRNDKGHVLAEKSTAVEYWSGASLGQIPELPEFLRAGGLVDMKRSTVNDECAIAERVSRGCYQHGEGETMSELHCVWLGGKRWATRQRKGILRLVKS